MPLALSRREIFLALLFSFFLPWLIWSGAALLDELGDKCRLDAKHRFLSGTYAMVPQRAANAAKQFCERSQQLKAKVKPG